MANCRLLIAQGSLQLLLVADYQNISSYKQRLGTLWFFPYLVIFVVWCSYYDGDQDKLFSEAHIVNPFKPATSATLAPPTTATTSSTSSIASRLKSKVTHHCGYLLSFMS